MRQISEVPGLRAAYFTPLNEVKTGAVFLIAVLNIVSKSVIIHAKTFWFSFAVTNRLKCLQNEPYTVLVFFFSFTVPLPTE